MTIYSSRPAPWTAEEDRRLRILWNAEWPTLHIALTIGRSKNAICGRARRLELTMRGTPIPSRVCPEEIHAMRVRLQEIDAGIEAARQALLRAA